MPTTKKTASKAAAAPAPQAFPQQHQPHFTVSAVVYDPVTLETVIIKRGAGVRSAPNAWAIPSGLLEFDESFHDGLVRELAEELDIPPTYCASSSRFHRIYRNIPGDGFDWVIGIWSIEVSHLAKVARNAEPHKHDDIEILSLCSLAKQAAIFPDMFTTGLADPLIHICIDILTAKAQQ